MLVSAYFGKATECEVTQIMLQRVRRTNGISLWYNTHISCEQVFADILKCGLWEQVGYAIYVGSDTRQIGVQTLSYTSCHLLMCDVQL